MKIIYRSSFLALIFLVTPALLIAQQKRVSIRIVQDESVSLNPYETAITLKRKSFKIQVMLQNIPGVYVFAAFSDSLCCRLTELDTIPDFSKLHERTMAEAVFNGEKELLVNDDNFCSYWFYDKQLSWHRFNRKVFLLDSNRVIGVKTVKQLYHVPSGSEMKLKDINEPLYLFFVAVSDLDPNGKPYRELIRKKVKIIWSDDDE